MQNKYIRKVLKGKVFEIRLTRRSSNNGYNLFVNNADNLIEVEYFM